MLEVPLRRRAAMKANLQNTPTTKSDISIFVSGNNKSHDVVNIIKSLRRKEKDRRKNYREELYTLTQEVVIVATKLASDKKSWDAFRAAKLCRERPGKDEQSQALRYVLDAVFKRDAKTTSLYARAVEVLKKQGVPDDGIADALREQGGFKKVASKGAVDRKKKHTKAISGSKDGGTQRCSDKDEIPDKYMKEVEALKLVKTLKSNQKKLIKINIVLIAAPDVDLDAMKPGTVFGIHAVKARKTCGSAIVGELRLRD